MPISKAMNAKLNEQITNEFFASHTYLAMACQFDDMGLKMLAKLYRKQAEEERGHALKILDYVISIEGKVRLQGVPEPKPEYPSVVGAIEAALEHERKVTANFYELTALAEKDQDFSTRGFLTWFVNEQVEEVEQQVYLSQLARMAGDRLLQMEAAVAHMVK
jgi:ferritin